MTALVTGAGGGIGRGIVEVLLRRGDRVVAQDLNTATLEGLPGVTPLAGDITDEATAAGIVARADAMGIEAVVAAHGISGAVALSALTPSTARRVMEVNTATVIRLARLVGPTLQRCRGAFVVIASQAALRPERENAIYAASKWAILQWAKTFGVKARRRGFAIRTLCPGRTDSPMLHEANRRIAAAVGMSVEAYAAATFAQIPLGRYATVDEIAAAALLLAVPVDAVAPRIVAVTGGEVAL